MELQPLPKPRARPARININKIPSESRIHSPFSERQSGTSRSNNGALDGAGINQVVVVLSRGEGSVLGSILTVAEVVAGGNGVTVVSAVKRLLGAGEDVVLDQELGTVTGVDTVVDVLVVAGILLEN
jgi:hypothetical protein